jgi:hypothetical protein
VWKRVIGTDVNPARRRLVTTEVRAHRFINQFAHRSSLSLAKILKERAPPPQKKNHEMNRMMGGRHQFWSEMTFLKKKRRRLRLYVEKILSWSRGQMKVTVLYLFSLGFS